MKLNNLTIAPKLGILVGITLLGLGVAGVLAGYLMQREMLNARVEQAHAIVEMARNMALDLQKQVAAGELTKEQAIAEFSRRGNSLTYDNRSGYLFGYTMEGITILAQDPSFMGKNRMDVQSNGRYVSKELRDGVAAHGEYTLYYDNKRPGSDEFSRKLGYAATIPNWDMFVGTGVYLDDIDAKMKPIAWLLGLATLGIGVISGSFAWIIGRSISRPLNQLGMRM